MKKKATHINCKLLTRGTHKANAQVVDDLSIIDPESDVGKQIMEDLINKEDQESGND